MTQNGKAFNTAPITPNFFMISLASGQPEVPTTLYYMVICNSQNGLSKNIAVISTKKRVLGQCLQICRNYSEDAYRTNFGRYKKGKF